MQRKHAQVTDEAEELKFQDTNYVELALRVLGLMCDGQNRRLQVRIFIRVPVQVVKCPKNIHFQVVYCTCDVVKKSDCILVYGSTTKGDVV